MRLADYDLVRKTGDRRAPIVASLMRDGVHVHLHGVTAVKIILTPEGSATADGPALVEACTITQESQGEVTYNLTSTFAALPAGVYRAEFEVMWPGSQAETYPNAGYLRLLLAADLGGTA